MLSLANAMLFTAAFLYSPLAGADTVVIVNKGNGSNLAKDDIAMLYLGKTKQFPDGHSALPLDQKEGSPMRVSFVSNVLGKSEAELKTYWARLIFNGQGVPPKVLGSDAEVKDLVARNPDTIGFIDSAAADDSVKVILTFK
jgi:ABC-type phosphate transport system substrate-binding protein